MFSQLLFSLSISIVVLVVPVIDGKLRRLMLAGFIAVCLEISLD